MSRQHIDSLSEAGAAVELATGAPTPLHIVAVIDPGKQRGDRIHLDIANGNAASADVTLVVGAETFIVAAAGKSITQLDFFVPSEATVVNVTGQSSVTDVIVLGFHEGW